MYIYYNILYQDRMEAKPQAVDYRKLLQSIPCASDVQCTITYKLWHYL